MANSTAATRPKKPRPDFPLFPDATGRWRKKILGKTHYFGSWRNDPKGERAIQLWLDQKDALLAGRKPRKNGDCVSIRFVCNDFHAQKEVQRDAGRITHRTLLDYIGAAKLLVEAFDGDRPIDVWPRTISTDSTPSSLPRSTGPTRSPISFAGFDPFASTLRIRVSSSDRCASATRLRRRRNGNSINFVTTMRFSTASEPSSRRNCGPRLKRRTIR